MKFTHTNNQFYRKGIGPVPKSWIDYGLGHKESILKVLKDKIKVWDADAAGYSTVDFVFEDGKSFRLEYSWWCNEFPENEDDPWILDEYDIKEIDISQANAIGKTSGRDWI